MPIYVKYNGPAGEGSFENASLDVDADLLKLSNAGGDSFLKIESAIKHDITVIGDTFLKWSNEFIKLSDFALKIDSLVIKLTEPTTTIGSAVADAPAEGGPQADFLKLDTSLKIFGGDLKLLGSDFLKLDTAPDVGALKITISDISGDFIKLGAGASDVGDTFIKLGNDLVALGTGSNNSLKLNEAYKILGGDLLKIGSAFDTVATDFLKLDQDFVTLGQPGTDLGTSLIAILDSAKHAAPGAVGADLLKLEHDFLLLNQTLAGSGPEALKLVHALVDHSGDTPSDHLTDHTTPLLGVPGGSNHG
jgi:hypothetical protein